MIEKMNDFFTKRVEGYDNHMMNNVAGCKEGYEKMSELLPDSLETLLDLGCGTGLELDEIFKGVVYHEESNSISTELDRYSHCVCRASFSVYI